MYIDGVLEASRIVQNVNQGWPFRRNDEELVVRYPDGVAVALSTEVTSLHVQEVRTNWMKQWPTAV